MDQETIRKLGKRLRSRGRALLGVLLAGVIMFAVGVVLLLADGPIRIFGAILLLGAGALPIVWLSSLLDSIGECLEGSGQDDESAPAGDDKDEAQAVEKCNQLRARLANAGHTNGPYK